MCLYLETFSHCYKPSYYSQSIWGYLELLFFSGCLPDFSLQLMITFSDVIYCIIQVCPEPVQSQIPYIICFCHIITKFSRITIMWNLEITLWVCTRFWSEITVCLLNDTFKSESTLCFSWQYIQQTEYTEKEEKMFSLSNINSTYST